MKFDELITVFCPNLLFDGPVCVKTQKRPYAVSFKLDCISGEAGYRWKGSYQFRNLINAGYSTFDLDINNRLSLS